MTVIYGNLFLCSCVTKEKTTYLSSQIKFSGKFLNRLGLAEGKEQDPVEMFMSEIL